jgi:4-carboxymuconolactone decarboxylase
MTANGSYVICALDGVAPAEAQGIGFTRELLMTNRVSEATFQSAADRFGLQGLVQLTALIGYYGMMACVLNAFEVPPVLRPAEPG